jgi:hypothetical protein
VSTPERQAEEGRAGFRTDFSPGAVPLKPMNYPVGKPLEVIRVAGWVLVIYRCILVSSPFLRKRHLTIAPRNLGSAFYLTYLWVRALR